MWRVRASIVNCQFVLLSLVRPVNCAVLHLGTTFREAAEFVVFLSIHPPFPSSQTKFVVVERSTGMMLRTRFVTDPLFFFHAVNAFEDDGHIVFDMVAYEDAAIMDRYYLDKLKDPAAGDAEFDPDNQGHFRRFVIPVSKVGGKPSPIDRSSGTVLLTFLGRRADKLTGYLRAVLAYSRPSQDVVYFTKGG